MVLLLSYLGRQLSLGTRKLYSIIVSALGFVGVVNDPDCWERSNHYEGEDSQNHREPVKATAYSLRCAHWD